jgi:hypothetical protein
MAEKCEQTVFYALAIIVIYLLPLGIPATISAFHAVAGRRQRMTRPVVQQKSPRTDARDRIVAHGEPTVAAA